MWLIKTTLPILRENINKWAPNYKDSYMVKKAFSFEALILPNMDECDLLGLIKSDVVNKCYA